MDEIILSIQPIHGNHLQSDYGINSDGLMSLSGSKSSMIYPYTPYLSGRNPSSVGRCALGQLTPLSVSRELTHLALSFGSDNVMALAEMTAKFQEYNIGLMGASTSVYANRMGGFAGAVKNYQAALMNYRNAIKSTPAVKTLAKQKAHLAFQTMQFRFKHELNAVTLQAKTRRGTPLTSATRAINIARSSRHVTKLNITSQIEVNNLVKLSKHAKFLGNGLAVIDFGSRVGNIHHSYQAGDNWERDLFIESSSFALSAATGTAIINAGGVALSLLVVATPVGWVGLIVGGIAVAGVAAMASIGMNSAVKDNSGDWYDSIMKSLGIK